MIVRIDEQASTVVAMSGEVNLAHAFGGHPGEIGEGIESVIGGADIDIVDVQQEVTTSSTAHLGQESPFGHFIVGKTHVSRGIFEQQRTFEHVLRKQYVRADDPHRVLGIWKWQEVVRVESFDPGPAKVVRYP